MSFILDALRKSENERQRLGSVGVADLPLGRRRTQPWWIIGIAALLIVNFVMLAFVLLRPNAPANNTDAAQSATPAPQLDSQSTSQAASQAASRSASHSAPQSTSRSLSRADALQPAASSLQDDAMPPQIEYDVVDRTTMEAARAVPDGPTLVRANPAMDSAPSSVPTLRVDMHVYSPQRESRFVFINMRKYFEGQALQEGPIVEQITQTGVVLNQNGRRWELDRP